MMCIVFVREYIYIYINIYIYIKLNNETFYHKCLVVELYFLIFQDKKAY